MIAELCGVILGGTIVDNRHVVELVSKDDLTVNSASDSVHSFKGLARPGNVCADSVAHW